MQPRNKKELQEEFKVEKQREIFFTMKVYANAAPDGSLDTLKYSIDFHPPFEANTTTTVEPYASPLVGPNKEAFGRIFHNVKEVLKFISDPKKYKYEPYPGDKYAEKKGSAPAPFRAEEQKILAEAIRLSKGAINHITFESNSPSSLTVGAVFHATGNGDMKPPPK
jgi:hypothetical protein